MYEAGVTHFGENYLDEALDKMPLLVDLPLQWHYIGRIQSNKTKEIAQHFHWVHTVDREKIARRLSDQCPPGRSLQILIQVNIDADPAKGGILDHNLNALLERIVDLPNLDIRGLMTILANDTARAPVESYRSMAQLFANAGTLFGGRLPAWDTLSMGMSRDLEAAVASGATMVRVGTDLFGPRPPKQPVADL